MRSLVVLATVAIGALLAMQPAINAEVARRAGTAVAGGLVSISLSLLILCAVALLAGAKPNLAGLLQAPWWILLGGLAGAVYVTGGIMIAPYLGAAAFIACIVFGQALGSSLVDQFGLFQMAEKPLNLWKVGGLAMMLGGLLVFQRGA